MILSIEQFKKARGDYKEKIDLQFMI